jgi:hypothetical protein
MDKRKNNGGARQGAGRPKKADEAQLIERLDSIIDSDEVIEELYSQIKEGNTRALTLYFNYRYGKPKESVSLSSDGLNINFKELIKFD